jgi:hypothetical protein
MAASDPIIVIRVIRDELLLTVEAAVRPNEKCELALRSILGIQPAFEHS